MTASQHECLDNELVELWNSRAISRVNYIPKVVSLISCVPKKTNRWRLYLNLPFLNADINAPHFSNENIDTVYDNIEVNDLLCTVDFKYILCLQYSCVWP